ncbi:patatin-domain-containing protein [Thozetella sp. PMI_491]|nr:patatin-domain-containing protein [Thozetella sp. PMI_491]
MATLLHIFTPIFRSSAAKGDPQALPPETPPATSLPPPPKGTLSRTVVSSPSPFSRLIRDANNYILQWRDGLNESERRDRKRLDERKQILAVRIHGAATLDDWEAAARELDRLEGNDKWKLDDSAGDYNPEFIGEKLHELEDARLNHDIRTMMYLVRTALSRDLGGMGNLDLYRHSYIGTKALIERYVDSAVKTVEAIVEQSAFAMPPDLEYKDLLEGMLYARQSFGRSALLLSGGATFGMAHIGVVKSLFESRLLPRIISGASAGSIICAVLCTRKDEDIPGVIETFPYGDLAVFEGHGDTVSDHVRRLLTEGSWADIKHLTRVMRGMLGDMTFQEAYNRTRRICNICVSTESIYELPRLLNYITAPNVMIWSAVAASCSVPLVFNSAPLLVKDPVTGEHAPWNPSPQRWIDGSVDNDLPMTRLAEMFNVNHFIVSQVNPHVVPFLSRDDRLYPSDDLDQGSSAAGESSVDWLYLLTSMAKDEALHRLHFLTELGICPNLFTKLRSILSQKYSGDITILPEIAIQDLPNILSNPTSAFMLRTCLAGERAAWPKLSRIRDRCAIELALDRAVHRLRARVVFSQSQVDLRRLATGSEHLGAGLPIGIGNSATPGRAGPDSLRGPRSVVRNPTDADGLSRRRRNSGSSIQLMARHKNVLQSLEQALTDEDTEQEERLEIVSRRGSHIPSLAPAHLAGRANTSKPRLKRAVRSHFHLPYRGPSATSFPGPHPLPAKERWTDELDFSRPLTPPPGSDDRYSDEARPERPRTPSKSLRPPGGARDDHTTPFRLDILSQTEDASEIDPHTSDADVEDSRTDDSDLEPSGWDPRHDRDGNLLIKRDGQPRGLTSGHGDLRG